MSKIFIQWSLSSIWCYHQHHWMIVRSDWNDFLTGAFVHKTFVFSHPTCKLNQFDFGGRTLEKFQHSPVWFCTQVSLAPIPVRTSVSSNVGHTFGFPFCQRHWNLTKRRDGIAMVDIELHMMADNPIFPVPLPSKKDQNCRDRDVTLSYKAWNVLKQVHFAEAVWCVSSKLISKFICPEMKMRF